MPTREGADVVPLRKETKARLARLKGEASYDAVIQDLLARAALPPAAPRERPRPPGKQLALARLAATRWRLLVGRGQLVELGPRLVEYRTGMKERKRLDVVQT